MLLENISNYVYTREDLLHETFLKKLQDWNPHEIFSSTLGLCYSFKLNQNITSSTQNFNFLSLPVDEEYQVSKGFYKVLLSNFPLKTSKIKILSKL